LLGRLFLLIFSDFSTPFSPTMATPTLVTSEVKNALQRRPGGGPRKLTARVFIRICRHIESGESVADACTKEGVTYRILRLRVAEDVRLLQRLKESERIRSEIRFERACKSIMDHGDESWMAHAWWLERSYPNQFALRTVHRIDAEQQQAEPELPAQILEQHRRLMLETFSETERESELSTK
jgi:hypothetical protein